MTKETTTRAFALESQNDVVRIEDIALHQAIEATTDARLVKHVWIEAVAVPVLARDTMNVDVRFDLHADGDDLGSLRKTGIEIDADAERIAFVADDDLRIGQNAEVSRIALDLKVTTVNTFEKVAAGPVGAAATETPQTDEAKRDDAPTDRDADED